MNTYLVRSDCWAGEEQALIGIYNGASPDDGTHVDVRRVWIKEGACGDPVNGFQRYTISRISAMAGGVQLSACAFNKAYSLPSQIDIRERPDGVTFDTPSAFRKAIKVPITGTYATSSFPIPYQRGGLGGVGINQSTGSFFGSQRHMGANLPIELTEGYGVAIHVDSELTAPYPITWFMTITLRDSTNSRTYSVQCYLAPHPGRAAAVGIMNGSGSGITLQLVSVDVEQAGETSVTTALSQTPYLRLARVAAIYGGESLSWNAHNKRTPAPSTLKAFRGGQTPLRVLLDTPGLHFDELQYTVAAARVRRAGLYANRLLNMGAAAEPNRAIGPINPILNYKDCLNGMDMMGPWAQPIVLRSGEGFAVIRSGISGYNCYTVALTVTVYNLSLQVSRPESVFIS